MARFNVTTTPTSLSLKPGESGTIAVVVSNRMGRPFLARVDPKTIPPAAAAWVVPSTVTQRQFDADPAATYNFEFKLLVPADAVSQTVQLRFDAVDPQMPDDPLGQGETVAVNVAAADVVIEQKRKKPIPWWVWAVAAAVVLVVGLGIYLAVRPDGDDDEEAGSADPEPGRALQVVEVAAPAINCVYDPACRVTVSDFSSGIGLPGTAGSGFLQSRTFQGSGAAPAAGRRAYQFRIDITRLTGAADRCITGLVVPVGEISNDLDYNGDGSRGEEVYVVTQGGLGTVRLSAARKEGNRIVFEFQDGLCPGATSFFFGVSSSREPGTVAATLRFRGGELPLQARAPQ